MSAAAERKILFDGADLVVVGLDSGRNRGVVTFGSWLMSPFGDAPAQQARGFIERAFNQHGLDELHIIPRRNHWYNCADRDHALALASEFAASRSTITCGSSMGGYGAALFSALLGVPGIAVSPQFSLDPVFAPFETRWREEFSKIEHFDSRAMFRDGRATGFILYDPFTKPDAMQAELFRGRSDLVFVPFPFSGHATVAMINRSYGLARMASQVANGSFEIVNLMNARRSYRRTDDLYQSLLYIQARTHGHLVLSGNLRTQLENRSDELTLKSLNSLVAFSIRQRDLADAAVWADLAARSESKRPDEWLMVSRMMQRIGDRAKAYDALQRGIALAPDSPALQREMKILEATP